DIITTDHAPHTLAEKNQNYIKSFGGAPMVQHALCAMLEFVYRKKLSLEMLVEKMCHHVADLYQVEKRGYIKEGYWADLVLVDLNDPWTVEPSNILYKCGWSPMEGETFHYRITQTFVNGNLVYDQGKFNEQAKGQRLLFERDEF
ncbi:MAG: amidohydrolase family protein, partial [Daejeonella sp.]